MPEDRKGPAKKGAEPAAKPAKGSLAGTLALYVGVPVVAALLAVGVFFFVIKPRLDAVSGKAGSVASADGANGDSVGAESKTVTVDFDQAYSTVLMPDPNMPASLLVYKVAFECANPETAAMVTAHKDKLAAMLQEVHSFRHRAELNDPQTKKSIERVALQKANDILQQYLTKPDPKIKIVDVFHEIFVVEDK